MAGRKPIHLTTAGGKPGGRQSMWEAMRKLRSFTVSALALESGREREAVRTYVESLAKAGYLDITGTEAAPTGGFIQKTNPRNRPANVYSLVRDIGIEAPRVKRDGTPCIQGRAREQMWRTMRNLGDFTPRDLALMASTTESAVSEIDAADYVKHLAPAGYLVVTRKATPKKQAQYRFVAARWTGPKAPMIQRLKTVFDANLGKIVWNEEVDA